MNAIHLATEDELSESIGERLVSELGTGFQVDLRLRRGGYGYLRSRIPNFCEMAKRNAILLITDLDTGNCARSLVDEWLCHRRKPELLLFRVAVHEIESWLLADHAAMKRLLGKGATKLPARPDELNDPKQVLLRCASRAPREVRKDLLADKNAFASQGLGYNRRLCALVREDWNPVEAALRSDSLRRARLRLRRFAESTRA